MRAVSRSIRLELLLKCARNFVGMCAFIDYDVGTCEFLEFIDCMTFSDPRNVYKRVNVYMCLYISHYILLIIHYTPKIIIPELSESGENSSCNLKNIIKL